MSGIVVLVRRDAAAAAAALLPGGGANDRRCILYTSLIQSPHCVVQIQTQQCGAACFAQLREPLEDDENKDDAMLSRGLWTALHLDDGEMSGEGVELIVRDVDEEPAARTNPAKCACEHGEVGSVELHFVDRTEPPRAVANGLKRVLVKLVQESTIWDGQRVPLNWFNFQENAEFKRIKWKREGTGCCAALGKITSATKVVVRFSRDNRAEVAAQSTAFRPMREYLTELSQELGGLDAYAQRLLQAILARLSVQQSQRYPYARVAPNVGAIISGLPGVGKTLLAKALCKCLGVSVTFLHAADIFQTYVGHSEAQLVMTFESVIQQAPSILVVDGIESITSSRASSADSQNSLEIGVLGTFLSCLEKIKNAHQSVFVLGTTSHLDDMDPAVFSNGRLDLIVRIEPPGQRERLEILEILTKTWSVKDDPDQTFLARLSEATGGFVGADLLSLCQKALQICLNASSKTALSHAHAVAVQPSHFEEALATTYPSVLQTHHVSQRQQQTASTSIQQPAGANDSARAFPGVYGMEAALQMIKVSLLEPLEDCSRFLSFGTVPPKGILLTGAPGSGKSHLANAVANEVRRRGLASFVSVNCTDLLTKVVGDTEKALRELFATARNAAPCVLYFDQIESIAPLRGFDTSTEQTFDRMLSMLLVEMDGFNTSPPKLQRRLEDEEARNAFLKHHVVVLASTTRKEALDPAILRPGRFDVHIHVDFPDEAAREQLVLDTLQKIPLDYTQDPQLADANAVAAFAAKHTSGMSAGDVRALFREAAMASMRERMDAPSVAMKRIQIDTKMRGEKRRPTPHMSAQLHERNRYKGNPPDFYKLAALYPSFKQYVRNVNDEEQTATLAWDDPFAVRELTRTLLLHDFQLQWSLPIDRLCPPLPNRLNYLHWIEDLLLQTNVDPFVADSDANTSIHGVDIGTGASCIYALLGARMNNWRFLATEVDADSYESALENVRRNALDTQITVKRVYTDRLLREPLEDEPAPNAFGEQKEGVVHFSMCNPPFFDDMSEADTNPETCCMGSSNEMVFPGGEVAFITNMIEDSLVLKSRVLWYTSMIGKKSTIRKILAVLREKQVPQTRTTEFFQGRTKRWGIAWTFSSEVAVGDASSKVLGKRKEMHRKNELTFTVACSNVQATNGCSSIREVAQRIQQFAESNPALVLDTKDDKEEAKKEKALAEVNESEEYIFYRLQSVRREKEPSQDSKATTAAFEGRIEITKKEARSGFEVIVAFENGTRNEFWKTADALKAATLRSGRQWRRKRQQQPQEQPPATAHLRFV